MRSETTLVGYLISGRGNAHRHLFGFKAELENKINKTIYHGTLNVILIKPKLLACEHAMKFDESRRYVWPAKIGNTRVWLYRWSNAPLHIVEILAEDKLRESHGLKDGDEVKINVSSEFIAPLSPVQTALWSMYWLGRRDWAYTNDHYYFRTKPWCVRFGITQHKCQ